MLEINHNFAECFHSMYSITHKVVTNVCSGEVAQIPYLFWDYVVLAFASLVMLFFIALLAVALIKFILN